MKWLEDDWKLVQINCLPCLWSCFDSGKRAWYNQVEIPPHIVKGLEAPSLSDIYFYSWSLGKIIHWVNTVNNKRTSSSFVANIKQAVVANFTLRCVFLVRTLWRPVRWRHIYYHQPASVLEKVKQWWINRSPINMLYCTFPSKVCLATLLPQHMLTCYCLD